MAKFTLRTFAIAVLTGVCPAILFAENITWDEAVIEAQRANPQFAASQLAVEASRYSYYASFNKFLPTLSLSNSVSESNTSRTPSWSASASSSLSLFDLSKIASVRSSAASLSSAQAALRQASANLRSSLRRAFAALYFTQVSLETSRSILKIREHDSELVTLRYQSGRESKGNMLRTRAQWLQAKASVSAAERDLRNAQREMSRQLGRESFSVIVASGALSAGSAPQRPEDFTRLLPLRTDVALAEASVRSARAARDAAQADYWPSLSANYSRSRFGATEFPSRVTSWSAGATLSYSLFSGGPSESILSSLSARRGYEKAAKELSATRQGALSELEAAWANFADATEQLAVQDALLEASRQRNDEADVRYASGLLSFDNWEVIVTDRVSSERQAISARRDVIDAETAWDRALGRALGE